MANPTTFSTESRDTDVYVHDDGEISIWHNMRNSRARFGVVGFSASMEELEDLARKLLEAVALQRARASSSPAEKGNA